MQIANEVSETKAAEVKGELKGKAPEKQEEIEVENEAEDVSVVEVFRCSTCGARVVIGEGAVKFPCPYCDELIVRCARCRKLAREYKSKCGFIGP